MPQIRNEPNYYPNQKSNPVFSIYQHGTGNTKLSDNYMNLNHPLNYQQKYLEQNQFINNSISSNSNIKKETLENKIEENKEIINVNTINTSMNYINNSITNNNEEEEDDNKSIDPDEKLFNDPEKEDIKKNDDNDEEDLSPLNSDYDEGQDEYPDFLIAQYDKVHRVKERWRITLRDAIYHCKNKEYVFDKVNGELNRDW